MTGDLSAPGPRGDLSWVASSERLAEAPSLAQIVAALSVTYSDTGVLLWLNSQYTTAVSELAEAVRRIGDADPSDFTMSDVERLAEIKADYRVYLGQEPTHGDGVRQAMTRLSDAAPFLLAALAAAEARVETLQRQVEAVRALHFTRGRNILGDPVCNECSPLQPMPCPTLRELDALATAVPGMPQPTQGDPT